MSAKATHSVSKSPSSLPCAGRIACSRCHPGGEVLFDQTRRTEGDWRITANPLAWGNPQAEIVVLGFSKGPTQAGALARSAHDDIAFRGKRDRVGKIFAHLGLIPDGDTIFLRRYVDQLIADQGGRFHFGSLIRCTVERHDKSKWIGSRNMLAHFLETAFGREIASNCAAHFLGKTPPQTRVVLLFGMGPKQTYVKLVSNLIRARIPGAWREINDVAYSNGLVTFVHVEHFAVQGPHLKNWLGINDHPRARLGLLAREAVQQALA